MAVTKDQVKGKAAGIIGAIENMTPKEREDLPQAAFAEDYNKLRRLALEVQPNMTEVAPPEADVYQTAAHGMRSRQRYGDILSFTNQILNLLD
jgi:hypothetical protein